MPWVETVSPSFRARFDDADADDVARALEALERRREQLDGKLGATPAEVEIVFHPSAAGLDLARPLLPLARRRDAPAARRYRAGAAAGRRIDVLAPRVLRDRASAVPGSREMLLGAPETLYARLALLAVNPALRRAARLRRVAWFGDGAPAWLAGQAPHAHAAVSRRLHEGRPPAFPPDRADALLLGATVFELIEREEGERAALAVALGPPAEAAVLGAFHGRSAKHTEAAWRRLLTREEAEGAAPTGAARRSRPSG